MTPDSRKSAAGHSGGSSKFDRLSRRDRTEDNPKPSLFQSTSYPETPGFKDDGAGRESAFAFKSKAADRRKEAFDAIGSFPMTADQIASKIKRPVHHVRPRLTELAARGDLVKAPGRGKSAYGAAATLWRRATDCERARFLALKALADEKGPDA